MGHSRSWGERDGGNAAAEFMDDVLKTFLLRNADIKKYVGSDFLTTAKEQFALGSKYTDIGRELGDNN